MKWPGISTMPDSSLGKVLDHGEMQHEQAALRRDGRLARHVVPLVRRPGSGSSRDAEALLFSRVQKTSAGEILGQGIGLAVAQRHFLRSLRGRFFDDDFVNGGVGQASMDKGPQLRLMKRPQTQEVGHGVRRRG